MSRFTFCNCPAGLNAAAERHAPDCPGRKLGVKGPTPVPATTKLFEPAFRLEKGAKAPWPEGNEDMEGIYADMEGIYADMEGIYADLGFSELRGWEHDVRTKYVNQIRDSLQAQKEQILCAAAKMTRDEVVAAKDRFLSVVHPDREEIWLDGEPLLEFLRPVFCAEPSSSFEEPSIAYSKVPYRLLHRQAPKDGAPAAETKAYSDADVRHLVNIGCTSRESAERISKYFDKPITTRMLPSAARPQKSKDEILKDLQDAIAWFKANPVPAPMNVILDETLPAGTVRVASDVYQQLMEHKAGKTNGL